MEGEEEVKKILGLTIAIVLIIGLVAGGTWALFSDTETAPATFTAGTLNLQVGATDPCTETISLGADLAPGDSGNAAIWLTQNIGSIAGDLSIEIGTITNNENTRFQMETDAGDPNDTALEGELGANLKVAFWMDVDANDSWSSGDYYLPSGGGSKVSWGTGETTLPTAAFATLDSYDGDSWADVQTNVSAVAGNFRVEYDLPSTTTNIVQSDDCVFDITFDLEQ